MKLFREAAGMEALPEESDWTRTHGYAQTSRFSFPDIYLHEKAAALAEEDPAFRPFLETCLRRFVNHDYGNIISMDQVENFLSRDIRREDTWMQAIYPTDSWGLVHLDIFYDLALFHLEETAPRDIALAQRAKERESR